MADLNVSKTVRRITVLKADSSGTLTPVTVYRKKRKSRKGTFGVRQVEKGVRRLTQANAAFLDDYLGRHNRANRRRKDGWVRDVGVNVLRAANKGRKRLRLSRMW